MTVEQIMILVAVITLGNVCCFIMGGKIFQQAVKGEKIGVNVPNPVKAVQSVIDNFEESKEQDRYKTIMENIDNYNGTPLGQKDLPRNS